MQDHRLRHRSSVSSSVLARLAMLAVLALACGACKKAPERPTPAVTPTKTVPPAAAPAAASQPAGDPQVAQARAVLRPLKKRLLREVMAAMKAGGPLEAIKVCQLKAPQISKEAAQPGLTLGRTSLKVRNPANAPTDWQKELLAAYQGKRAGEAPRFKTARLPDGSVAYVEPIYVRGPVCLTCHGDAKTVPPAVAALLSKTYPKDQATGYAVGDFRGLFWVKLAPQGKPAN